MNVLLGRREAQPLDLMSQQINEDDLRGLLTGIFPDATVENALSPRDDLAEFVAALFSTPQGRELFEWLMDITLRAPLSVTGPTIEATALNAARREGAAMIGEAVLAAIARGHKSIAAKSGARR